MKETVIEYKSLKTFAIIVDHGNGQVSFYTQCNESVDAPRTCIGERINHFVAADLLRMLRTLNTPKHRHQRGITAE